jgi:hypothetical protein
VTGGGAHNPIIMETLKEELKESRILSGDEAGITTDFKEAAAFALMGTLPSVGYSRQRTGSHRRGQTGHLRQAVKASTGFRQMKEDDPGKLIQKALENKVFPGLRRWWSRRDESCSEVFTAGLRSFRQKDPWSIRISSAWPP